MGLFFRSRAITGSRAIARLLNATETSGRGSCPFIKCATDAVTLSVLLGFFGQVLKIADGRVSGFSKCGLLPPLQDFSRTHSLYDPVTDGGGLSAVNQDVSNIAADLQPSIRRGFRLAQMSRRNQAQSLFPKSEGAVWNSKWDVVRLGFAEFSCMRLNFS